ncbi:MAG TPA: DUF3330 domain-containing protein [Sulfuricella sp.]|nr:DUF3330 domain-containing protein [Sulfuricella sp.]
MSPLTPRGEHIRTCSEEELCDLLTCEFCRVVIPESAAVTFEGADYVIHFCGLDCLEIWKTNQPAKILEPGGSQ